mmetsp:Transcript_14858/g.34998  ORF Transcript_14858/g.34998 Transcript_14858/m.34998 type:complete len:466 (-) Transcript_14858:238-1635(-)
MSPPAPCAARPESTASRHAARAAESPGKSKPWPSKAREFGAERRGGAKTQASPLRSAAEALTSKAACSGGADRSLTSSLATRALNRLRATGADPRAADLATAPRLESPGSLESGSCWSLKERRPSSRCRSEAVTSKSATVTRTSLGQALGNAVARVEARRPVEAGGVGVGRREPRDSSESWVRAAVPDPRLRATSVSMEYSKLERRIGGKTTPNVAPNLVKLKSVPCFSPRVLSTRKAEAEAVKASRRSEGDEMAPMAAVGSGRGDADNSTPETSKARLFGPRRSPAVSGRRHSARKEDTLKSTERGTSAWKHTIFLGTASACGSLAASLAGDSSGSASGSGSDAAGAAVDLFRAAAAAARAAATVADASAPPETETAPRSALARATTLAARSTWSSAQSEAIEARGKAASSATALASIGEVPRSSASATVRASPSKPPRGGPWMADASVDPSVVWRGAWTDPLT